jgi:chromosomal replication initiator protein
MTTPDAGSAEETFTTFKEALVRRYGKAVFRSWFEDLMLDDAREDSVTLSTESDLRRDRLDQQFKPGLLRVWSEDVYPITRLRVVKRNLSANAAKVDALSPASAPGGRRDDDFRLDAGAAKPAVRIGARSDRWTPTIDEIATPFDQRLTFENFAVDETNEVAAAACRQVFLEGAPRDVLYIFGQSGVGKSHLVQACGNEWLRRHPRGRAAYLTHNNVQSGCVGALLSNSTLNLQRDFLANDLVIIDDIHLLAGKKRTLDEVLNLMNAISNAGKQLIIAGELPPAALAKAGVHSRLADRLAGGLAVRIAPGGENLRREVLAKHRAAGDMRCTITDEALDIVARLFGSSMRECIGAYKQLALVYRDQPVSVGTTEAMAALEARFGDRKRKVSLEELLLIAAEAFGLAAEEMLGRAQPQRIARARHAFVLVARSVLAESFPRIGRALGRDHTTVISSLRRAEALIVRDKAFQAGVTAIKAALGAESMSAAATKSAS